MRSAAPSPRVAVVIPCYRVAGRVAAVVRGIPEEIELVVAVDDGCPDGSGLALRELDDPRLLVLEHVENRGVGAAVITGYLAALLAGAEIIVKMDGDGQMSPDWLDELLRPILAGEADYAKGNRFTHPETLAAMPPLRLAGNAGLSLATKLVSGYWSLFDPTNGYTAVRADYLRRMPLERLAERYFFETSMLVELGLLGAVVRDVEMPAIYEDEQSSLSIGRVALLFPGLLLRSLLRRFVLRHLIRDMTAIAPCLLLGLPLVLAGAAFGGLRWWESISSGVPATAGTVLLAALPIVLGFQLALTALLLDVVQEPRRRRSLAFPSGAEARARELASVCGRLQARARPTRFGLPRSQRRPGRERKQA